MYHTITLFSLIPILCTYNTHFSFRYWSDPDNWPQGELPKEGDDVTITSTWRMILDVTPPPLGDVYVHGELHFEDMRDYEFVANRVSSVTHTCEFSAYL